MLSKAKIKLIVQLKQKKHRELNSMFVVEGSKNTIDFLKSSYSLIELFATENWIDNHITELNEYNISTVTKNDLNKITALSTPSEVLAIFELPNKKSINPIDTDNLNIALDDIRDPGNLGTIIRTADWFGITNIYCSTNTVDVYNPKVVQATMGSLARVKVSYVDLEELLTSRPKKMPVYGALLEGEPINNIVPQKSGILLTGSEAHGISNNLIPLIDNKVTIPLLNQNTENHPESLNASIATAIICYALKISV